MSSNKKVAIETMLFHDAREWEAWLAKNHDTPQGIWMLYHRVSTGKECIVYKEALEIALMYGWIDSILKKVDDSSYVRKFSPRRPKSQWSAVNLNIVRRLISEGRMTDAGMKALSDALERKSTVPEDHIREEAIDLLFQDDPVTREAFEALPASHRKQYSMYILSAKSQETRDRRMKKAAPMIREGKPPLL
ncbi:MAG: YdeI/OmpD-associated family protein [Methanomassiliicoccales archaeon]|nr:YdeI/OmpD-associated family protein [Methanomassiliicoccales archaeon]